MLHTCRCNRRTRDPWSRTARDSRMLRPTTQWHMCNNITGRCILTCHWAKLVWTDLWQLTETFSVYFHLEAMFLKQLHRSIHCIKRSLSGTCYALSCISIGQHVQDSLSRCAPLSAELLMLGHHPLLTLLLLTDETVIWFLWLFIHFVFVPISILFLVLPVFLCAFSSNCGMYLLEKLQLSRLRAPSSHTECHTQRTWPRLLNASPYARSTAPQQQRWELWMEGS